MLGIQEKRCYYLYTTKPENILIKHQGGSDSLQILRESFEKSQGDIHKGKEKQTLNELKKRTGSVLVTG